MPNKIKIRATDSFSVAGAPLPHARMHALSPYKQGKAEIPGRKEVIKLSSNENPFGPSPAALEAFQKASLNLHRYPDGSQSKLRQAIAAVHDIEADRIVCGNGSEELIGLLLRCFLGKGDEFLLPTHHFLMCPIYGKAQEATIVIAPEKDMTVDVDAMLERITSKTRVISIANPNNPTGTYVNATDLKRFIDGIPSDVLLILDGAYAEYVTKTDFDDGMEYARSRPNVVVTRTFSKIYGLAGMRIGWAYGPAAIIEVVNRLRTPFNASGPSLAAAAAAMADQAYVRKCREHNAYWLTCIRNELEACGLHVIPSVTNFYLLDFSRVTGKSAQDAIAQLESRGIIPRPGESGRYLRITVGTDEENQAVLDTLGHYLKT